MDKHTTYTSVAGITHINETAAIYFIDSSKLDALQSELTSVEMDMGMAQEVAQNILDTMDNADMTAAEAIAQLTTQVAGMRHEDDEERTECLGIFAKYV